MLKYRINLVRTQREEERRSERRRRWLAASSLAGFGSLGIALVIGAVQLVRMHGVISEEQAKLQKLKDEYQMYQATKMTVDKDDIELLDSLQRDRIFWTRKLASLARHLPDSFWITRLAFDRTRLAVQGYGYISPMQEQLITLDRYIDSLRADTTYRDDLPASFLRSSSRTDVDGRRRVSFEFVSDRSAQRARPRPPEKKPPLTTSKEESGKVLQTSSPTR